ALRFKPWISANPLPAIVPEHHPHQNPNRDTQYQNEPPTGNPVSAPQNWLILSSSPIYKPEPYEPQSPNTGVICRTPKPISNHLTRTKPRAPRSKKLLQKIRKC